MAEDIRGRYDALSEYEQNAVRAIMGMWDYSIEDALTIVDNGGYDIYPMGYLDPEAMSEDARREYDALTDEEQRAMAAILEVESCSIAEALLIIRNKTYEFYPDITSMGEMARKLVHEEDWYDPYTVAKLDSYIDYDKLGIDLYTEGYCDTRYGVIIFW